MENSFREGVVSSVNAEMRTVQVVFPLMDNMVSGNLKVLQHAGAPVIVGKIKTGEEGTAGIPEHGHGASLGGWMPSVGQRVFCFSPSESDSDGFVLGGL